MKGIKNIRILNKAISSSAKKVKAISKLIKKDKDEFSKILSFSQSSSLISNKTNIWNCF